MPPKNFFTFNYIKKKKNLVLNKLAWVLYRGERNDNFSYNYS
ncbi:hypothetical protein HMPREF3229_00104 [Peptoniphilus harei]|uniref:Uncharacterized protein n=1 Tax=Peptoniphilus harei TaxID=54005 RepID=A0A133PSP8_9FIRM|nr:hypothetical protein HMPREF3229_00104 [Peptoniphilus harei]